MANNERGSILITSLIFMLVLSFMLMAYLDMSSTGLKQVLYTEQAKKAFYVADGGMTYTTHIIDRILSEKSMPPAGVYPADVVSFNDDGAGNDNDGDGKSLVDEILGFANPNDNNIDSPDITITFSGNNKAYLNLAKVGSVDFTGTTSGEFASGYEGIGAGAASGGVYFYIQVDSLGKTEFGSKANI
ncbi:MAG: hypothetical protein N2202_05480, partial [Proteobacteria bacterium]|nr:hypothetical protein [Pseudomonadota bacterium]